MDGRSMFVYYGSLLLFLFFFVVVEKPRSPGRVQPEEDLIKQTQPGVEGFPLSLKNSVVQLPTAALFIV